MCGKYNAIPIAHKDLPVPYKPTHPEQIIHSPDTLPVDAVPAEQQICVNGLSGMLESARSLARNALTYAALTAVAVGGASETATAGTTHGNSVPAGASAERHAPKLVKIPQIRTGETVPVYKKELEIKLKPAGFVSKTGSKSAALAIDKKYPKADPGKKFIPEGLALKKTTTRKVHGKKVVQTSFKSISKEIKKLPAKASVYIEIKQVLKPVPGPANPNAGFPAEAVSPAAQNQAQPACRSPSFRADPP
jgi:hypothetical protein